MYSREAWVGCKGEFWYGKLISLLFIKLVMKEAVVAKSDFILTKNDIKNIGEVAWEELSDFRGRIAAALLANPPGYLRSRLEADGNDRKALKSSPDEIIAFEPRFAESLPPKLEGIELEITFKPSMEDDESGDVHALGVGEESWNDINLADLKITPRELGMLYIHSLYRISRINSKELSREERFDYLIAIQPDSIRDLHRQIRDAAIAASIPLEVSQAA